MEERFKDLIRCAEAITDDDIEGADWLMLSNVDPFLGALFNCIYNYRHPHEKTEEEVKISRKNAKKIAKQIVCNWKDFWEDLK